jgi:hypothetical protein
MIVGIVGSEESKFTSKGRADAEIIIVEILAGLDVTEVVSGKCHLGGIDVWAAEFGEVIGLTVTEYPPEAQSWWAYKKRNLQIAARSDIVHCITVDRLPESYTGMRFGLCYHCGTKDHVKSGGCWTMKQAIKLGKTGVLHVIEN